jgi:vitamin B12/bleomycin/antimicrobial peptide transport system ATP-binding/permease protein
MRSLGPFLRDAWRLTHPYFVSEEKWSARGLLLAIVTMRLFLVALDVVLSYWNRAFFNALQAKDWDAFINLLLFWHRSAEGLLPGFVGVAIIYITVAVYRIYITQALQIRWRRWMTERFMGELLSQRAYYRISLEHGVDPGTENPDQRISEDLRNFIGDGLVGPRGVLSFAVDLLSNIVSLFSFVFILWSLSGSVSIFGFAIPGYMVWVALLYAVVGTWLTHLVGRPLATLNFAKQRVEADFRFALMRLRENTEGVALSGGEAEEHRRLSGRFAALVVNWWALMRRNRLLVALTAGYGQVASIFPIVVAAPRYFSGQIALGGLTQTAGAFGQVQGAMSWFVDSYSDLASWQATVNRLVTFHRAIVRAHEAGPGLTSVSDRTPGFHLEHATLTLPDGAKLTDGASLDLAPGTDVVLSGRSGSGKSTLFRALAGIWPFGTGVVRRPEAKILFLPQRPYIPLGTLRQVVAYPSQPEAFSDAATHQALDDAGLSKLIPELDVEDSWAQRLSGGEQQRVAVARALLAQPDWLFLDEATASLDPEAEEQLYMMLRRRLPRVTLVSIAHRPSVSAFHDRHIVFERPVDGPGQIVDAAAEAASGS